MISISNLESQFSKKKGKETTKDDLLESLKKYDGVLAKEIIDYLSSVINLEFSVIENNIDSNKRDTLSNIEIYKDIAIYNIYHRALNIFNNDIDKFNLYGVDYFDGTLRIYFNGTELFSFDSRNKHLSQNNRYDEFVKNLNIGEIKIKNVLEDKEKREAELLRVLDYLEHLYSEKNPYLGTVAPDTVGGPASTWAFEHARKIQTYEEKFNELDKKKDLTDEDKELIEMANKYHELILNDYKLTDDDFNDDEDRHFVFENKPTSELKKVHIKKMPNLVIKNTTQYI